MAKLISVMIVDDEKLMIEDMKTMVDWDALGFEIVATAFNGKQALRKYRELSPQLIFSDIRMPFMDGIEMISEIRKADEKTNIVLLTAYEDFSYAKAAIRLGITEYMIKSEITENSLSNLLKRLKMEIIKTGKRDQYIIDRMLEQFFLSSEMAEDIDIERVLKKPEYIIVIEQDLPISLSGESIPENIIVQQPKLIEILAKEKICGCDVEAITGIPGRKIVIGLNFHEQVYNIYEVELIKIAQTLQDILKKETGFGFTLYIVQGKISLYDFKRYYDENKKIFLQKYLDGCGKIRKLDYSSARELLKQKNTHTGIKNKSIEDILSQPSILDREKTLLEILNTAKEEGIEQFVNAAQAGYRLMKREYQKILRENEKYLLNIGACWENWLDAEKIIVWMKEQLQYYHEYVTKEIKGYSRIISDVIEYIGHTYRNPDLSLNDIAEYVHLSSGYLSSEFKKETGVNLKSYITDVRIEAAKNMMDEGNYKIYEICAAVGYHSSQYFSQAFYKKTGMFPTEYLKNGGRKNEA